MIHPTDQERAREVAAELRASRERSFSFHRPTPETADEALLRRAADAIDALLAQPSPSDDVRGLIERLEQSIRTASNDDYSEAGTDKRERHVARLEAMRDAGAALARLSTPPSSPVSGEGERRVRHKARGSTYTVVGHARVQSDRPLADMAALIVYRGDDGELWARNAEEFNDDRFEDIAPSRPPEPAESGEVAKLREAEAEKIIDAVSQLYWQMVGGFEPRLRKMLVDSFMGFHALPADDEAKRIRAALAPFIPFAKAALVSVDMPNDRTWSRIGDTIVTVGDLRAVAALAQPEQGAAT